MEECFLPIILKKHHKIILLKINKARSQHNNESYNKILQFQTLHNFHDNKILHFPLKILKFLQIKLI